MIIAPGYWPIGYWFDYWSNYWPIGGDGFGYEFYFDSVNTYSEIKFEVVSTDSKIKFEEKETFSEILFPKVLIQ